MALPPPPTNDQTGSFAWLEWFRQLRNYITQTGSVPWSIIDFAGSTLSSIASRSHQVLQALQGGTTGEYYHVTSAKHSELVNNLSLAGTSGTGIKIDNASPTFGWRDLLGNISPKATGAGSPSRAVYNGGTIGQYKFVANDVVDFEFHIPHDYVPGSDLHIHIHWSHNGTAISGNAVFDFYHTYSKGHNQANFPAEKTVSITYNTTDITTTPRYRHRIDEVVMSNAGGSATLMDHGLIEPDGVVLITLKINTLPTITAGNLFVHYVDLHYQSNNLATKNKAPSFYA